MNQILEEISNIGVVPVVAIDHKDDLCPISRRIDQRRPSVCRSYIPYTCRGRVHPHYGRSVPGYALLGAGTVLTTEQADRAILAGAKFIVSPGFNPKVVSPLYRKKKYSDHTRNLKSK